MICMNAQLQRRTPYKPMALSALPQHGAKARLSVGEWRMQLKIPHISMLSYDFTATTTVVAVLVAVTAIVDVVVVSYK